ncbi:hypothetical protein KOR42_19170 [Thalassoglobus neptunius]|uniref:YdhG-like domain-containing protein n=1 Tax=Thalassoglobus neptunius TaxID=1938619 RepID=A0A5C5X682_9PLAN|nr:DUF1801 domain-containing protein [Thalassoglobus neptunius]TWT58536.1 hypothetical protein KOR42_19170 [Thalassoglobus neptunius]
MDSEVDTYLSNATSWKTELTELRRIVLSCNLSEEFKWRIPVYCHQNANVVSICALKDSCVLSFFKGALLKDAQNILSKPGENTRSARVIRFSNVGEIIDIEPVLIEYIKEAVAVEESGLKFDFKKEAEVDLPAEVQAVFDDNSELKQAFDGLTPGRQRAYAL